MKIAMCYELFWPSTGGPENWIASISSKLVSSGHEVDVITGGVPNQPESEIIDGVNIFRLDNKKQSMAKLYKPGTTNLERQLVWTLGVCPRFWRKQRRDYDIIHAHIQSSLVGVLLGAGWKRLVWSLHGTYHPHLYKLFPLHRALFYEVAEHISTKLPFSACLPVDDFTTRFAVDHLGLNPDRTCCVPNGIDTDLFRPFATEKPSDWPEGFYILAARRLIYNSGIQFLIRCLNKIVEKRPDVYLMVYGQGPYEPNLRKLTKELNLNENVYFMGTSPYRDMPKIYNLVDVAVIPSISEGMPLGCLEAMSCEKPVIASATGGLQEISASANILSIKAGDIDSLHAMLETVIFKMTAKERREFGYKARKYIMSNFTLSHTTNRLLELYERIIFNQL